MRTPQIPTGHEAANIREAFAKVLSRDPQAVINSTRDMGGHVVLNADDLFKRWPEYARNPISRRWLGSVLYEVARTFIDQLFVELLEARPTTGNTVVFTAGGGASGKSTILRAQANRQEVDFVVDTTFSNTKRAIRQIDEALKAGRLVEINYVCREIVHDQADFFGFRIAFIEHALDKACPVFARALLGHSNMAAARQRLHLHEDFRFIRKKCAYRGETG
ncbi:MAG: hypothetical protein WCH43_14695 [Verrucomicrobiota bacterium]